ncbi:hypothetical protein K7432_011956 [Basidiobolus ranarum]|uniref:Uncharacterized protein n=1 Tax=Basidiobolus ranarum TaxID=34480 RepID=A0ABR2VTG1_9FUNG
MHHAFVDKIWADWQDANPSLAGDYSGVNHMNGNAVTTSDVLEPFGYRVADILSTTSLCYRYPEGRNRRSIELKKRTLIEESMESLLSSLNETLDFNQLLNSVINTNQPDYASIFGLPNSFDREQEGLNVPAALDLDFINMYGFDVRKVRTMEMENAMWIKKSNQMASSDSSTDLLF